MTITECLLALDPEQHGQGYSTPYTAAELDDIADNVAPACVPGSAPRLSAPHGLARTGGGEVFVPPGHDVLDHPNRAGADPALTDAAFATTVNGGAQVHPGVRAWARRRGWDLDQHGRPVNPHHHTLLADPRIGLTTSLGLGWRYGESVVADAVVLAGDRVLITTRDTPHDGTIPAIPGGYTDPRDEGRTHARWATGDRPVTHDGVVATAVRKLCEETGVTVPGDAECRVVRGIRPTSSVHTLHAWTVVYTVRVTLPRGVRPQSAFGARWLPITSLDDVLGRMWPDHRRGTLAGLA